MKRKFNITWNEFVKHSCKNVHMNTVNNGSGLSLKARNQDKTEPLPDWRSGLSIHPNRPLVYGLMEITQPIWIGWVLSWSLSGSIHRSI